MRYLPYFLILLSSFVFADVNITPPTAYENGDPLPPEDIQHYEVCISQTDQDICDSKIDVTGGVIKSSEVPENTHHIKARTVTVYGEASAYSNTVLLNRKPGEPKLDRRRVTTTTTTVTLIEDAL
jgi:hypothetical protein